MKQTQFDMIRGALPLMWIALIGSGALLYSLPAGDPGWGVLVGAFHQWYAPMPVFILLTLLTFLLGLPSKKELGAAAAGGIAGSVALTFLASISGPDHIGWLLIATFFLVVPLSGFLFRRLMLCGGGKYN